MTKTLKIEFEMSNDKKLLISISTYLTGIGRIYNESMDSTEIA